MTFRPDDYAFKPFGLRSGPPESLFDLALLQREFRF